MSLSNASIVRLANSSPLLRARESIKRKELSQLAITIQQIAAPTFHEQARGEYVIQAFRDLGLKSVTVDAVGNVYGWLGEDNAPALVVSAHMDTVFPKETDLTVREEGTRIHGPGIGDNSLGVAALLMLAQIFSRYEVPHSTALCFVANTREEGLGNLDGMRAVADALGDRLKAAIVIEGMALGRVYHAGIAVRRLKVTISAPGGHSWLHYGEPSAIHHMMQFGAELSRFDLPQEPRTTLNVGLIEGGSSINTIAPCAACYIDLRSEDPGTLADLEGRVRELTRKHRVRDVSFDIEVVGDRPAGRIENEHPLVRLAIDAHHAINMPVELETGSTDANALLGKNIPAVCVGVSYGGNAHVQSEYVETLPFEDGLWQLLLLITAASNGATSW